MGEQHYLVTECCGKDPELCSSCEDIQAMADQLAAVRELPEKWKRFDHSTWRFSPSYILVTLTDELEAALNGKLKT